MFTSQSKRGAVAGAALPTVAYFCAEYGISDSLPIYSGGLGVLAGDIVQEAADMRLPFIALGLFYRLGYFHQHLDQKGQEETVEPINPLHVPLELIKNPDGETLLIEVPVHERIVYAQVWRYPVKDNSLYLLDTDHWKNSQDDRQITNQLYAGDQAKRIQQELVLGIGGFRLLQALKLKPNLYHMNEGHSAFLCLELVRDALIEQKEEAPGLPTETAVNLARQKLLFTNHTLVPAGNDLFPNDLIRYYLGRYAFDSKIGIDAVLNWGSVQERPGFFSMTLLALRLSARSNAVSKLHAQKAVKLWPNFRLQAVTNGVHLPAWVAPELQQLWSDQMGPWQERASNRAVWKQIRGIDPAELWKIHQELKSNMLNEVYARTGIRLEPDTLTVVWARRFASYKRPDLLFSDIERLKKLLFDANRPIQVIVSGKSHPLDGQGKEIIKHIEDLANFDLKHRAVFVDDYSISLARFLVAGADVWLNTPIFGLEASGTSGMKAAANGVIQCTVPDGWAYEVDWYGIGYSLPVNRTETGIYPLFEKKIIPTYYSRNRKGVPEKWVNLMKESILTISPHFSSARMMEEYLNSMYLPTYRSQM